MTQVITRDEFFAVRDITTTTVTVPDTIPAWAGKQFVIKQLTRGEQDIYLERQFGSTRMRQNKDRTSSAENLKIYGHDGWLVVKGVVQDEATMKPMFFERDIPEINKKQGELIGWLAHEIIKFSGMEQDDRVAKGEVSAEESAGEDIKNS